MVFSVFALLGCAPPPSHLHMDQPPEATTAATSPITESDVIGAWSAALRFKVHDVAAGGWSAPDSVGRGWLVLWPDHLWWYGGALHWHFHGGARWRLVGDTLWLANDYDPYFHPMIGPRIMALEAKGYGLAVMDSAIIHNRPPYPVPDSLYWSAQFRDTTSTCAQGTPGKGGCGTWVYKVSKQGQDLVLTRLDNLSRATATVATWALLKRDTLVGCNPIGGCDPNYTQAHH